MHNAELLSQVNALTN